MAPQRVSNGSFGRNGNRQGNSTPVAITGNKIAAVLVVILLFFLSLSIKLIMRIESLSENLSDPSRMNPSSIKGQDENNIPADDFRLMMDKRHALEHKFPIHASHDLEKIDHPGILFADVDKFNALRKQHPELPSNGKIKVPKFWRPKAYG